MKTDYCLILSAGFGSRMRTIGTQIPKPLWPVFEKTILEIQIDYARMLGAKTIFVNTHFLSEQILLHFQNLEEYEDIHFLVEKDILDIGGAIHNLARLDFVNYDGRLMILNGDQFIYFNFDELKKANNALDDNKVVMMAVKVDPKWGHAQTFLNETDHLTKIVPNQEIVDAESIFTYSGMAFVDLNKLARSSGKTSLYETVATYKTDPVKMIKIENYEYWDFGTIERYWHSMFRIIRELKDDSQPTEGFIRFLLDIGAIDINKLELIKGGYNSSVGSINLSSHQNLLKPGQILLSSKSNPVSFDGEGVICGDLVEKVKL